MTYDVGELVEKFPSPRSCPAFGSEPLECILEKAYPGGGGTVVVESLPEDEDEDEREEDESPLFSLLRFSRETSSFWSFRLLRSLDPPSSNSSMINVVLASMTVGSQSISVSLSVPLVGGLS